MSQHHLPRLRRLLLTAVLLVAQTPGRLSVGHAVEHRRNCWKPTSSENRPRDSRRTVKRSKVKGQRGRTLNGDVEVPLVFSRRVGDHAGVLALVGQQGALYVEDMSALLKASVDGSSQQLRTEETTVDR